MKSLKQLYKIGNGPSSSHTMGVKNCCLDFLTKTKNFKDKSYKAVLYDSLAYTGCGHLTDYIIKQTIKDIVVTFDYEKRYKYPNALLLSCFDKNNNLILEQLYYSIGGGDILVGDKKVKKEEDIYKENSFDQIKEFIKKHNISLDMYVDYYENIDDYLKEIINVFDDSIKRGLSNTGLIPGKLGLKRAAKSIYENDNKLLMDYNKLFSYAYAVSEENACGNVVVTAPTCGASGVLPSVIRYLDEKYNIPFDKKIKGLKVAGIIGNLIKKNASISGAKGGCQAEIGTACSMASAYTAYVLDGRIQVIERSAEIALEHLLGLTCDPVLGYVQIPCIERNAIFAKRSIDSFLLALTLKEDFKISFDMAVLTMNETGNKMHKDLKETSIGGLARYYKDKNICS